MKSSDGLQYLLNKNLPFLPEVTEEIVIFAEYQNKGYGAAFMEELEKVVRQNGVEHLELISVNDEHHMHFYKKLGFYAASNLAMMGKHFN